ncbi:MAG: hypothetical protein JO130_12580 [Solirubrobacterales bacterium]|nr:hypothetical protein [Solirubrobacterales bacterium]
MPIQHLELAGIRRSVLVALGVAILIPVAVVVYVLTNVGGSSAKRAAMSAQAGTMPVHTKAKPVSFRDSALFQAVAGVNDSPTPSKGYLPPSTCKAMSSTMVLCTHPHYAVYGVALRTYPSATALYAAYEARVAALSGAPFKANYGNCTETDINGEIGWNHSFRHPSYYPVSMFTSGKIRDVQAAGRVFCTFENDLLDIVWTQDDGRLMGEVTGAPHLDTYLWWKWVHHSIVLPGFANPMQEMPGMASTTSTHTSTTMSGSGGMSSSTTMSGSQSKKSSKSTSGMSK